MEEQLECNKGDILEGKDRVVVFSVNHKTERVVLKRLDTGAFSITTKEEIMEDGYRLYQPTN